MKNILGKFLVVFLTFLVSFTSFTQPSSATAKYNDDLSYELKCFRPDKVGDTGGRPVIISFSVLPQEAPVKKFIEYTGVVSVIGSLSNKVYARGYLRINNVNTRPNGFSEFTKRSKGSVSIYSVIGYNLDGVDGFLVLMDNTVFVPEEPIKVAINGKLKFLYATNTIRKSQVIDFRKLESPCFDIKSKKREWEILVIFSQGAANNLIEFLVNVGKLFPPFARPGRLNDGGWFPGGGPSF